MYLGAANLRKEISPTNNFHKNYRRNCTKRAFLCKRVILLNKITPRLNNFIFQLSITMRRCFTGENIIIRKIHVVTKVFPIFERPNKKVHKSNFTPNMKNLSLFAFAMLSLLFLGGCAGIQLMTIETQEPAQVTLPANVRSILIVDNVVEQPNDVGHNKKSLGKRDYDRVKASADSISTYYTEALTQFLSEENYFDRVLLYDKPLRSDNNFWEEQPLTPEKMNELRRETNTDAVISLDKLILQTDWTDFFMQEGYMYANMTGKIHSILRAYLPTMEGRIPAVQFTDSMRWEGFDIRDEGAYADMIIPTPEQAMKQLAVFAAEKMTNVFAPHWEMQNRWYYTLPSAAMRDGEALAKDKNWTQAIEKWTAFYRSENNKLKKAKAANNIALGYEMLGQMDTAYEWITISKQLFDESTTPGSLDRKRVELYMNEIARRRDNSNKLNMQTGQ